MLLKVCFKNVFCFAKKRQYGRATISLFVSQKNKIAGLRGTECTCQEKLKTMIMNLLILSGGGRGWGGT